MSDSWQKHESEYLEALRDNTQKNFQQQAYAAGVPAEKALYFKMDFSKISIDTTALSPIEIVCAQAVQSSEVLEICNQLIEASKTTEITVELVDPYHL